MMQLKNQIIYLIAFITINCFSTFTQASSTFVGNGGSSRDLELQVTLSQLKDLTSVIESKSKENSSASICTCDPYYSEFDFCITLSKLSESQQKYCSDFVVKQNKELKSIHQGNATQIQWTEESMAVQEGAQQRAVEAVTDFKSNKMTIQKETFFKLKPYERLFLLSHEFYHLTEIDGKPLLDNAHYGPFASADGGKLLLNAASAAQTQLAYKNGIISQYTSVLNRSRYVNWNYFSLGFHDQKSSTEDNNNFGFSNTSGYQFKYRFQPGLFGFAITSISSSSKKSLLSTINATENRYTQRIGATLRTPIVPSRPESFFGQSHVVLEIGEEMISGDYQLKDSYVSLKDTAQATAPYLTVSLFAPLQRNFWFYFEATLHQTKLNYKELDLKSSINNSFNTGISYGF